MNFRSLNKSELKIPMLLIFGLSLLLPAGAALADEKTEPPAPPALSDVKIAPPANVTVPDAKTELSTAPAEVKIVTPAAQPLPEVKTVTPVTPVQPEAKAVTQAAAVQPETKAVITPAAPVQLEAKVVTLVTPVQPEAKAVTPAAVKPEGRPAVAPEKNFQAGALMEPLSVDPTDFNFNNTDILFILKTFALRFNKNIIPSAAVAGKVTLFLKQVPFDEAFQILLDKMDLVAIQRSRNIIEVMGKKEMPLSRETFSLKERLAGDIKTTLDSLLTPQEQERLTIAVDGASNSLIVTATAAQLGKVRSLVNQMDIKTPQIRIKTRIVELKTGDDLTLGISWAGAIKHGGVTARAAKDIGGLQTVTPTGITPTDTLINTTYKSGAFFDLSQIMDKAALYGVLNMLAATTDGKTLSEPSIMTGNNKTAKIHVGQNLPVKTVQVTQNTSIESISYVQEGIDLEVTPVVSPGSKQISLKIRINVSDFVAYQDGSPITAERSAFTEITMESEKTVAIGGLVRETTLKTVSGIPILKSIPLLGALFRSKTNNTTKTDMLILLTPEIVRD